MVSTDQFQINNFLSLEVIVTIGHTYRYYAKN